MNSLDLNKKPANSDSTAVVGESPTDKGTVSASSATETPAVPAAPDYSKLPASYLANGYFKGEGKGRYVDPELQGVEAQGIAQALAAGGMKPNGYNPILRGLKKMNKKTMPLEAKTGALQGAIPKAKLLEQRKRAPHLLVELLEKNKETIKDGADYEAAYQHLEAIGAFLGDYQE